MNAFVAGAYVCLDVKVILNPNVKASATNRIDTVKLSGSQEISVHENSACKVVIRSPQVLSELLTLFNGNHLTCRLSRGEDIEGTPSLRLGPDCDIALELRQKSMAKYQL